VIDLVPMTQEDFLDFAEEGVPAYAADKVKSGEWAKEEALGLAGKAFEKLLPQGLATPHNLLFTIRDSAVHVTVGKLWIAVQDRGSKRIAYIYDVSIKPEHQRRGYATRAFAALEEKVRALGLSGIAVHVFGHNAPARALYEKLGYQPTDVTMFKAVGKISASLPRP